MKISLIIPVYNVEKYLEVCLKSVESQTYTDFEVIIVNDGSTDNSYKIIDEFVNRNPNFSAYTIENRGLGGARNYGIEKATGDCLVFLDSDDYISSDCLQLLANAMREDVDMVVCTACDVTEDGRLSPPTKNNIDSGVTTLFQSPQIMLNRPCAWAKMYRRHLFDGLAYESGVWYEDLRLTPKLYHRAKSIVYIPDAPFFYLQRAGSIMNNSNALRNLEIVDAFEDLIAYFKSAGDYDKLKDELDFLLVDHIAVAAITRVSQSNDKGKKAIIKKLQNYLKQFNGLYSNKYMSQLGFNKKLILFFNRNRLYCLTNLCMKLKSKLTKG